jgi:hypothetical protein
MIYLYREGNGFVGISWNDKLNAWVMHVVIDSWSLSEYKRYKEVFKVILEELKKLTPFVYSLCLHKNHIKFNKAFGFEETGAFAVSEEGDVYVLLKLEL